MAIISDQLHGAFRSIAERYLVPEFPIAAGGVLLLEVCCSPQFERAVWKLKRKLSRCQRKHSFVRSCMLPFLRTSVLPFGSPDLPPELVDVQKGADPAREAVIYFAYSSGRKLRYFTYTTKEENLHRASDSVSLSILPRCETQDEDPVDFITRILSSTCINCGVAAGTRSLRACSVCLAAKYCCKTCQKEDWSSHKSKCHLYRLVCAKLYASA